ncbi:MAG: transketolase [Planctomycetes bacterium]|nr:transketolase [Planctomycetota bacterium]
MAPFTARDQLAVNALRILSIDAVENAKSGHPGLPLGAAPMAYVLWSRHLTVDPRHPDWADRDRFVLSAGHGSALLYALLHLSGFEVSLEDLKAFRQWGSRTPGHPEFGWTKGVEATTGPLGQGAANSVGMALAERHLAHRFHVAGHRIVDHRTYALVSDGDLMEGIASEVGSLAGHLGLSKLTWLYDANDVCLDGPTSITFTEDVGKRYEAFGWQVLHVADADRDLEAIDRALERARAEEDRPTLVVMKTTIGFGSPGKQGTSSAHGSPLGAQEVERTRQTLNWNHPPFVIPDEVRAAFATVAERGHAARAEWKARFAAFASDQPERAAEWERRFQHVLPAGWNALPAIAAPDEKVATRIAGQRALEQLAERVPELIGGDADLGCSTMTRLPDQPSFDGLTGAGFNIHFGVREHAMGAIANGMLYHGGTRPFVSTFFVFSDYMRAPVRLAALSHLPAIYVWTHDSIHVGEDGPTHQPIEHLASLRAMPNLDVIRPADATETHVAWQLALERTDGPTALVLSRQKLPVFDRAVYPPARAVERGAYVLRDATNGSPTLLLLATGSEVHLALEACTHLEQEGVPTRVVSMPCWERFQRQDASYRDEVLPPSVRARVAIEAGASFGWERWTGTHGRVLALDRFGASAPGERIAHELGFTVERVVALARESLAEA